MLLDHKNVTVKRFNSPEDYLAFLHTLSPEHWREGETNWYGTQRHNALQLLEKGDVSLVHKAEAIISQISTADIQTPGVPLTVPSVVGFMPLVPAVLAGLPENMLTRVASDIKGYQEPLVIYADASVSGGISEQEIMNKGVAILSYLMLIQNVRPVELYLCNSGSTAHRAGRGQAITVKLTSNPLDLARACFMLTSMTYCRRIALSAFQKIGGVTNYTNGSGTGWVWNVETSNNQHGPLTDEYEAAMRRVYDIEPDVLFIKHGYMYDKLMKSNPIAWVRLMIEKHIQHGE